MNNLKHKQTIYYLTNSSYTIYIKYSFNIKLMYNVYYNLLLLTLYLPIPWSIIIIKY